MRRLQRRNKGNYRLGGENTQTLETVMIEYLSSHFVATNLATELMKSENADEWIKKHSQDALNYTEDWKAPIEPEPNLENVKKELRYLLESQEETPCMDHKFIALLRYHMILKESENHEGPTDEELEERVKKWGLKLPLKCPKCGEPIVDVDYYAYDSYRFNMITGNYDQIGFGEADVKCAQCSYDLTNLEAFEHGPINYDPDKTTEKQIECLKAIENGNCPLHCDQCPIGKVINP